MVKRNAAALGAILLGLPAAASAQTIQATICVDVDVDLDDADLGGAEDFYADNGAKDLRGVRIKLEEDFGAGSQTAYADWTGADAGCATFTVSTATGNTYTATIRSEFSVRNATIEVRQSASPQGMLQQQLFTGFQFLTVLHGTTPVEALVGPHQGWRVGAVAGRALARSDGGYALTPTFYIPDAAGNLTWPASCTGPCIVNGDDIYLSASHAGRKFAIAHHLGWVLLDAMGGPTVDDSYSFSGGYCVGSGAQNLGSLEASPFAAAAGFAHLYAAFAFNTPGPTCGYTYWRAMNWDDLGAPCFAETETSASEPMSCATGRAPLVPPRNHLQYCEHAGLGEGDIDDAVSIAVDYQRMWWELLSGYDDGSNTVTLTFDEVLALYADTIASGWPATGHVDFATHLPSTITSAQWEAVTDRHGVPRP